MYGLTRDFIRNGGAFMVLEKTEGLRMDELSRVQMGMLSSNEIPRLLPVHIRELDRNITLQYDISGYKMLSPLLKFGKIKLRVLYGLLFQLADTFTECRQYMLDPRKLLLQEEYIFIHGSLEQGELGMVYVPIINSVEVDPTSQQFRELVIRLMAHVQELQGEGIQRVLQLCNSEHWDIRQLRELLLELYADEQSSSGSAAFLSSRTLGPTDGMLSTTHYGDHASAQPFISPGQYHYSQSNQNDVQQQLKSDHQLKISTAKQEEAMNQSVSGFSGKGSQRESLLHPPDRSVPGQRQTLDSLQGDVMEVEEKSGSSKVTYIILGCMVAMALVWRFIYMEQPGQTQMVLSSVLSLALLGVAVWVWVGKAQLSHSKSNSQRKDRANEGYTDTADDKEFGQPHHGRFRVENLTGGLHSGSPNKRPTFWGLGKSKDKQKEEMFQESWRWNASEMSSESDSYAQGYSSQQSPADMPSAQSEMRYSFESRSAGERSSRFQNLHIPSEGSEVPLIQHSAETGPATSELSSPNAEAADVTVNLQGLAGGGVIGVGPVIPSFYLERRSIDGNNHERMDVRGASFVIGRSADMVQWVDTATGVSRAHVELSRNKSGYVIKDLGSVNGTILQGNVLPPYKEYPLEDGYTFTLAESVYTYRSVG